VSFSPSTAKSSAWAVRTDVGAHGAGSFQWEKSLGARSRGTGGETCGAGTSNSVAEAECSARSATKAAEVDWMRFGATKGSVEDVYRESGSASKIFYLTLTRVADGASVARNRNGASR
jgi:hypothetical protein